MIERTKLEALVWKHTHKDYKGKRDDGTKTISYYIEGQGTCSVPLSSLSSYQLWERLPRGLRERYPTAYQTKKVTA